MSSFLFSQKYNIKDYKVFLAPHQIWVTLGILPLKIVAPITEFKEKYKNVPWMIKLNPDKNNNLGKVSVIDTFQVRSVSEDRLIEKIGEISEADLSNTLQALKLVFGII